MKKIFLFVIIFIKIIFAQEQNLGLDYEFFVGVINSDTNSYTIFNFNSIGNVWIKQNDEFIKTNNFLNESLIINGNSSTRMTTWKGADFYSSNEFYACVLAYGKYLVTTNKGYSYFYFDLHDCNYPFEPYSGKHDIWFVYDSGNDKFFYRTNLQQTFNLENGWKTISDSSVVGIWQIKNIQPNLNCFLSAPDNITLSWENNYLKISWDRIDLANTDSYYIYKSVDGSSEILTRIEPQQLSGDRQSWIDYNVTKPKRTDSMFRVDYRIRTRTIDGIFSNYSSKKSIYGNTGIRKFWNKSETEEINFNLSQNTPNPFNPSTMINYSIPEAGFVQLKVYNSLGEEIATLVNEFKEADNYNSPFSSTKHQLPSGIYFYQLQVGQFSQTKKMILLR
ncbi:MAG: hypothetical protein Fur0015_09680 [Ignavibacteriales bacterium]